MVFFNFINRYFDVIFNFLSLIQNSKSLKIKIKILNQNFLNSRIKKSNLKFEILEQTRPVIIFKFPIFKHIS